MKLKLEFELPDNSDRADAAIVLHKTAVVMREHAHESYRPIQDGCGNFIGHWTFDSHDPVSLIPPFYLSVIV